MVCKTSFCAPLTVRILKLYWLLQTREWVLPSKDTAETDWITANARQDALAPLALTLSRRGNML